MERFHLRDASLALQPDLDVLDAHGIRRRQADNAVQLDRLRLMLVTVEDNETIVGSIGQKSAL